MTATTVLTCRPTTLPHFLVGLVDGLGTTLDADTVDAIHQKLAEGSLAAATIGMPWYLAGIVEGVAREVRDLVMLPLELPDLLLATEELIELLSGPAGSEVARALGLDLAGAIAGEAHDLLELGPFDAARWLGLRVAPLLSDTVLCLLTAGAATVALRTVRITARYLPDLKTLARLARSVDLPDPSPVDVTPGGPVGRRPEGVPEVGGARDEALLASIRGEEGTDLLSDIKDLRRGRFEHAGDGLDDVFGGASVSKGAPGLGKTISEGHAFGKHVVQKGEFKDLGIETVEDFAQHVDDVVSRASGPNVRSLSGGRTAYWDDVTSTVVIHNPSVPDAGTAFRPTAGRAYFEGLE